MSEIKSVAELVREAEQNDITGTTTISKYVTLNMRENIEKIEAYINSKHISGENDSMGRDKPFFNIVTAAVNIWYRATDIDRKNIKVRATKSKHVIAAFIASILLQDWMNKASFGQFLNKWGRTLAKYGSAVLKFVVKNGELYCEVTPWNRMICDSIDFNNNIKIEKLWLTPSQLKQKKGYNQEIVKKLLEDTQARQTATKLTQDNKSGYIPIYEVHGELSLMQLTGDEKDKDVFVNQMHVISFLEKKERSTNGKSFDEYTLVSGKEPKEPYMITHLIEEDGRTLAIGAVENLFEAQWMVNHTTKAIKDQLDLTSKLIFQTADGNFVGQNALSAIESGDILIHTPNNPITNVALRADITSLQAFGQQWQVMGQQVNNISESAMGMNPPSGTAWRQTEAILQESRSLFELMTENKGLYIEEMLRKFVIPFIKTKMDTTDEISAILTDQQIKKIDSMYVPNQAIRNVNQKFAEATLNGEVYSQEQQGADIETEKQSLQEGLSQMGNQRFIAPSDIENVTWKEALKDLEWEVDVDVTGENKDTQAVMTTLNSVFQTMARLNGQPMSPDMKVVFNKILESTGHISPMELSQE